MKRLLLTTICCGLTAAYSLAGKVDMTEYNPARRPGLHSTTRQVVCLNGTWRFVPIHDKERMFLDEFPDPAGPPEKANWTDVLVPGFFKTGRNSTGSYQASYLPDGGERPQEWRKVQRGWYRKDIFIPTDWKGKDISLRFDAVAFYAKVFLNDTMVGEHMGPVTPFSIDVTKNAEYGVTNTLSVYVADQYRVSYCPPEARGYSRFGKTTWHILPEVWQYRGLNAGIWKDVYLEARAPVYIDDIFAMPSYRKMEITGRTSVKNTSDDPRALLLSLDILDLEGNKVLEVDRKDIAVLPHTTEMLDLTRPWKNPKLWDIDEPNLYYMRARLNAYTADEEVLDEKIIRFGFRETWVEKDQIYLNGRILHLRGDWILDVGIPEHPLCHRYEYSVAKFQALRDLGFVGPRHRGYCHDDVFRAADDVGFPLLPTGYAGILVAREAYDNCINEWSEYIKSLRNHPSVLIWSVQNESLIHFKTHEHFALQRKLDEVLQQLDPTRPYYHDGHARNIPEDPGAMYENGDLAGNAPISGGHYMVAKTPEGPWLLQFDNWRRTKPFIYGESGPFNFFSRNEYKTDPEKAQRLANRMGKYMKTAVGCWRSYGVSGIMAHGVYTTSSYYLNPEYKSTEFVWNDLNTPGMKAFSLYRHKCRFNPYEPDNPPQLQGAYADWVRKAFSPLLVTLYRDPAHNFYSGQKVQKPAYVVNDTKKDIRTSLNWTLTEQEKEDVVMKSEDDVVVRQGVPLKVVSQWKMPRTSEPLTLKLDVSAETKDRTLQSEDDQTLNVYPKDPEPQLRKTYHLYDKSGETEALLKKMGVHTVSFGKQMFEGNPSGKVLLVGPMSFDSNLDDYYDQMDAFIANGGVVIVLNQHVDYPASGSSNLNVKDPSHPLFQGLAADTLEFWHGKGNLVANCAYTMPRVGEYVAHLPRYYFEMKKGKGTLLGCNLLLVTRYGIEPEARLLLHNLLRYADAFDASAAPAAPESQPGPDEYLATFKRVQEAITEVTEVTPEQRKKFHFVNLKFHANAVHEGSRHNPEFSNVQFWKLPTGDWSFSGIPFHVVDPETEEFLGGDPGEANSFIVLQGQRQPKYPAKAEGIKIDRKARRLHFLHASAWAISLREAQINPDYDTLYYILHYADGSTAKCVARNGIDIADWWVKIRKFTGDLKEANVAWAERNKETPHCYAVLWAQSWDNPHPEKEIKTLDIVSADNSVPMVFAITLED